MPKAISVVSMPILTLLLRSHRQGRTLVKTPRSSEDWSYQLQGGLEFQVSRWFWRRLGWRWLRTDFVSAGFTNKTDLSGPFVQGGVNF